MDVKIDRKIVGYEVVTQDAPKGPAPTADNIVQMHEKVQRPPMLVGCTYKIKQPGSEHALYVTINDIVLNEGSEYELRRPFEIFINSKNMDHFQWIVALTRIMSAVFRKGGDVTFLVEELHSVFDPTGGYFKKGGKFMPSLIAEIGEILQQHLVFIGMLKNEEMSAEQKAFLKQKKEEAEAAEKGATDDDEDDFPTSAQLCHKCHTKAVVVMDGCNTCLSCGDSKCG